eukprot:c21501_g1_i2 orf=292-4188(+)
MAPYRGPVFSQWPLFQGRAWLPPWLDASSRQTGAAVCETPSMFAMSWKDLDEPILNGDLRLTPSSVFKDVTNKSFPCLHLSEDMTDASLNQGIEALELQLCLSQTQMTTDTNPKCGLNFKSESEGERNLISGGNTVSLHPLQEGPQLMNNRGSSFEEAPINDKAVVAKRPVSLAASQSTGATELFIPPAPQSSQFIDKHRISSNPSAQLHVKRPAEMSPSNIRDEKKLKSKNAKIANEDIQAAIGLTVATAETLVIADIMNGCQLCHSAGTKAILDAALMLKREREASGLDDFTLEDLPYNGSPDPNWDEDLDDNALEAEYLATLPTDSMKEAPCGNACTLADMQLNKCLMTIEIASTKYEGIDNNTGNTTAQHHQIQREESCNDAIGVVQEIIHALPVLDENGDEGVTSRDCSRAEPVAPKDPFNSRWLGGWTGVSCEEIRLACHNLQQTGKKHDQYFNLETSELSESCDLRPPAVNLLRCPENHQNKDFNSAAAFLPEVHVEALTAGSCAEILLALSQASVKCSLQEPLCSFVPCSVNVKLKPSATEPPGCNGAESNGEMAWKHSNSIVNGLTSGRPCDNQNTMDEPQPMLETSPTRGVKRMHSNSLKRYSTNPFSSLHEGIMQITEKEHPKQVKNKKEMLDCVNQTDSVVKADGSTIPCYKSALSGQYELILEDSGLQDSPPLIWHRGKKRRLRACRITESSLTQSKCADTACDFQPDAGPAFAKISPEPGIISYQDCEGFRQATLVAKDDVRLQSLDNHFTTELHTSNTKLGVQEAGNLKMNGTGDSQLGVLDKTVTKHKVYNRKGRSGTSSQLFKGIDFLVTGFPASQKNVSEEICKKIQEHGGAILSSVPNFSSLDRQKILLKQQTTRHSIVIAPQKVRTLKYLYGCAAALLIVRPSWLDESIAMKSLAFKHKCKRKECTKQHQTSLCPDEERSEGLIFSTIAAFVYGQRSYCSKLSSLIQHGGGKVVQSVKSLVQANKAKGFMIQIVVAEHQSKLPDIVKETAASSGLPIVSGDWIINSLLNGRLIALPAAAKAPKDMKASTDSNVRTVKPRRKVLSTKSRQGMKETVSIKTMAIENALLPCEEVNINEPCVSFLGKGVRTPALSRMGLSFVLEMPKTLTSRKLACGHMYYKAVCINGVIYTAGDVVEIRPETGEEEEPYVAQIESFYAGLSGSVKTWSARTGPKGQPQKQCFVCCRWFYRPSDTGFPCVGTGKELYLSQHFDNNAPVHSIIRKVQLVLFVDGRALTNDNEKGWKAPTETSFTVEAAHYVCRFFYDYQKESLHQLKSALTL